ncbi:TadE/TadG family type IV pilus assembly protein [Alteraurantiacibacter palmitatis]|uniref:TadE/TadG family type IV pilus assembly protein n=1 Tax=Alteraurantiacibacter palmitatis TaxID=2054628 RepID=A0ABV7E4E4_9SPHN
MRRLPFAATARHWRRVLRDTAGLAATEFAIIFPALLGMGLMGLELANRAIVQMQINQLAMQIADNASRIGEQSRLTQRKIYESDIQDLFYGAEIQAGQHLDLYGRGRVILSSLEVVPGTADEQYIHWQRCMGNKRHNSSYGMEGDGLEDDFPGMGPPGEEVIAFANEAVMFVEIAYDYRPLIGNPFGAPATIQARASFTVRDDRDLSQIYQRDPASPDQQADCGSFGSTAFSPR